MFQYRVTKLVQGLAEQHRIRGSDDLPHTALAGFDGKDVAIGAYAGLGTGLKFGVGEFGFAFVIVDVVSANHRFFR